MGKIVNYRDLDAWKIGMVVVEQTYALSALLPAAERYGLCAQMRRSSVSIPSNIAEGQSRGTARNCLNFVRIALGSSAELETQVELARRLRFVSHEATRELQSSIERVRRLLYGMRREQQRRLLLPAGSLLLLLFLGSACLVT
jgi:four helix bundle protein